MRSLEIACNIGTLERSGKGDFLSAETTNTGGNGDSIAPSRPKILKKAHWDDDLIDGFDVSFSKHEDQINNWKNGKSVGNKSMDRSASMVVEHGRHWKFTQLLPYSIGTVWALYLMYAFGWGDWAMINGRNPSCKKTPVDWEIDASASFCMLSSSFEAGSLTLKILSAFILGGFLMSSRNLWLTRRTSYCALCGATRNILINVCTLVPPEHQQLFVRWSVLGFELSVLKARMLIDSDEGKEYLQACGLIKEDEWESMVNGDRHTTVWVRIRLLTLPTVQFETKITIFQFLLLVFVHNSIGFNQRQSN